MARAKKDLTDPRVQGQQVAPRPAWDELVSPQELARRLDVPVTTIYGWRSPRRRNSPAFARVSTCVRSL